MGRKKSGKKQFFRGLFNSHDFKILKMVFGEQKKIELDMIYIRVDSKKKSKSTFSKS